MVEEIKDFTKGPILGPLLAFSMPILLALFLQALYGAVDLLVVGKYAQAQDVSAVAIGSQIMQTITGLVSSFAMGTTVLLGQKIGAGQRDEGGKVIGTSIVIFFLIGVGLTLLVPTLSSPLARLMNAPEEAFAKASRYIAICGLGAVMIVAYNVLGSILRGLGDSKTPLTTVAIASTCNIAGDLWLVAGLHMGAAGAAIATVASQAVSVLISLLILARRALPFSFSRKDIRIEPSILRRIVRFGTPIALQDLLVGLSFLVILAIVNSLGLIASAGVGVAEKVCTFIMLIPAAFMQAMSAYVAQNHGAGKTERAERGLRIAIAGAEKSGVVFISLHPAQQREQQTILPLERTLGNHGAQLVQRLRLQLFQQIKGIDIVRVKGSPADLGQVTKLLDCDAAHRLLLQALQKRLPDPHFRIAHARVRFHPARRWSSPCSRHTSNTRHPSHCKTPKSRVPEWACPWYSTTPDLGGCCYIYSCTPAVTVSVRPSGRQISAVQLAGISTVYFTPCSVFSQRLFTSP